MSYSLLNRVAVVCDRQSDPKFQGIGAVFMDMSMGR